MHRGQNVGQVLHNVLADWKEKLDKEKAWRSRIISPFRNVPPRPGKEVSGSFFGCDGREEREGGRWRKREIKLMQNALLSGTVQRCIAN